MKLTGFLGPDGESLAEPSCNSGAVHTAMAARATASIEISIGSGTRAVYTTFGMTTHIDNGNGRLIGFGR